jgi:hypothetical protein
MTNEVPTTDAERTAFAAVLKRVVATRFGGKAKAAYTAADVNSGTWTNLVNGRPTKPYTVITVVNAFWPEADGDWRRIPEIESREPTLKELRAQLRDLESQAAAVQKQIEERTKPRTRRVTSSAPGEIRPIPDRSGSRH